MAYTKHEWTTGETITATNLNHMEDGIASAGGVMVVNSTFDANVGGDVLDKTWQEIYDAVISGQTCIISESMESETDCSIKSITAIDALNGGYDVITQLGRYSTNSADGYPVMGES